MYIKKSEYSAMQEELEELRKRAEVNDALVSVNMINPQPGEFVIVRFKIEKVTPDASMSFIRNFKKKFPDNRVIAVSDWLDVDVWTSETMRTMARELLEIAGQDKEIV